VFAKMFESDSFYQCFMLSN